LAKILKRTDRIKFKVGEVTFTLAPFTYEQKMEMSECITTKAGVNRVDMFKTQTLMLKYGVKDIDGVEDYELEFDSSGNLTDECISELLYLDQSIPMLSACYEIHNGLPDKLLTEGVELEVVSKKQKGN